MIVTCSVGTDHIDIAECARRNIKVANTPNVSTDTVAEATVGLTIAAARRFKYGLYKNDGTFVRSFGMNFQEASILLTFKLLLQIHSR